MNRLVAGIERLKAIYERLTTDKPATNIHKSMIQRLASTVSAFPRVCHRGTTKGCSVCRRRHGHPAPALTPADLDACYPPTAVRHTLLVYCLCTTLPAPPRRPPHDLLTRTLTTDGVLIACSPYGPQQFGGPGHLRPSDAEPGRRAAAILHGLVGRPTKQKQNKNKTEQSITVYFRIKRRIRRNKICSTIELK